MSARLFSRFFLLSFSTLMLALPGLASAKDLSNRLGVGYTDQAVDGSSLPSIALRYFPGESQFGFSAALGVDTKENNSRFGLTAKAFRVVFAEDNMNFLIGAGGGIISRESAGSNASGFEISGFFGGEFFLPGLESLGFNFEAGVGVSSISNEVRFRTIGDHPVRGGITFYF